MVFAFYLTLFSNYLLAKYTLLFLDFMVLTKWVLSLFGWYSIDSVPRNGVVNDPKGFWILLISFSFEACLNLKT